MTAMAKMNPCLKGILGIQLEMELSHVEAFFDGKACVYMDSKVKR